MEKLKFLVTCALVLVVGAAGVALGDWDPGGPHKMHFPQEPDPCGWDVFFDQGLADDWRCTQSGPVTDIHLWCSFFADDVVDLPSIDVLIYSDDPVGPGHSQPNEPQWSRRFTADEFTMRWYGEGDQGFILYLSDSPPAVWPHNHKNYYQINITDIPDPFEQEEGTIYWLYVYVDPLIDVGWKTSLNHFNDAAVWWDSRNAQWAPMSDPCTGRPLDLAFVITGQELDFGDAPDPTYPTWLASDGARHIIGGPYFCDPAGGDAPDPEPDGQPDPWATGDDLDADGDDEDGVNFPLLIQGQPGIVSLDVCGGGGIVEIWIDYNGDEDWDDAGELEFSGWMGDGPGMIVVNPPVGSVIGNTFARCRISSRGMLSPKGQADDGEVEDHMVLIVAYDYGDAPDPTYPTLLASDGARHEIVSGAPWLGPADDGPDADGDGQADPDALGDDNDGNDDEDGVSIPPLARGVATNITVEVSGAGVTGAWVYGWIDFSADGDWDDAGEMAVSANLTNGVHTIAVTAPAGSVIGETFARFRISSAPLLGAMPDGRWNDGEVEDYKIKIVKPPVPHLKWSQPPIEIDPTAATPIYCGWDQPSYTLSPDTYWEVVADDFRCLGTMPIDSVHWWGSYVGWEGREPPYPPVTSWRIGFWSNVPADPGADPNFSHPEKLLWQIEVPADRVEWEWVGYDQFPGMPPESCFQYYVKLRPEERFWQGDYELNTRDNVFWISIAAIYPSTAVQFPWGWKTRPWHWMDDAVTFQHLGPLNWGTVLNPALITPIKHPTTGESFDAAFELDTDPNYIKWEQPFTGIRRWPHYEDIESMGYEDDSGALSIVRMAADDWPCRRRTPVTALVWWGSYIGYRYEACGPAVVAPPVKPDYFLLRIYDDVPAGTDVPHSHPNNVLWEYKAYDYDEVLVGYDKHPAHIIGPPREPVFRYSVRLPRTAWFRQKEVYTIYWLSVTAVYKAGTDPTYHWGWTNHKYGFKDAAVVGYWEPGMPTPVWRWDPIWSEQAKAYVDLSFVLFTEPGCFPCAYTTYWDWLAYGKPGCWCALPDGSGYQCVGDADQATSGFPFWYRVYTGDLGIMVNSWKMKMGNPGLNPCADMDHKDSGFPFYYRVYTGDLSRLVNNWKKTDAQLGIPGPCPMPE